MKKIKLFNSPQGWQVRFEDDTEIVKLFGTDTLPTAFTESASPMMVLEVIKKNNPGYEVKFNNCK